MNAGQAKNRSLLRRSLLGGLLAAAFPFAAFAQTAAPQPAETLEMKRSGSAAELEQAMRDITLSKERTETLASDVAALKKDQLTITTALIQSAKTEKKLAQEVEDISGKLNGLAVERETLRASLSARRGVLSEVLGALQRMGLNPPPALLVRPEDALASVRSAILLGAVVPGLREETAILAADLAEMQRITAAILAEKTRLGTVAEGQLAEKQRLSLLLAEKKKLRAETEGEIEAERQRTAELARKAGSLKELIAAVEAEMKGVRKAETERKRAEELAGLPVPEENRIGKTLPFEALKGAVAIPVSGRIARHFGEPDGTGAHMLGDTLQTQSGAIVTAPADGVVLYAGDFRTYGQLLILDAGGGYHVVLAGMAGIIVSAGQSVLAGEPIGAMGESRVAGNAAFGDENALPALYVEFRKNGKPVDPAPWWAGRNSGRTGNGT